MALRSPYSISRPLKEDRARRYIAALLERVHLLRQTRIDKATDVNDEASDERDEQNYAVRILTWLRNHF